VLADGYESKTDGVTGRKRAVETVKNSHLVAALLFAVQFQGNASPVTTSERAAPPLGGAWFQRGGDYFSGD